MKRYLILFLFVLSFSSHAQSFLNIETYDGNEYQVQVDTISKITFTDGSLYFNLLEDIQKITFTKDNVAMVSTNIPMSHESLSIYSEAGQIKLTIPNASRHTRIYVFDSRGRLILKRSNDIFDNKFTIDGTNLSTGIYLIKVNANNNTYISKLNFIK